MDAPLRQTSLYEEHLALGARMVSFAGWEMPVQYEGTGPLAEHHAVRTAAGLFDVDHMGQVAVSGPDAEAFLNDMQTVDVSRITTWGAHYSHLPYADGGLVDDIFIYRLADAWWLVVNAANREKDLEWLRLHAFGYNVHIEDISEVLCMIAIQGPKAQPILQQLADIDLGHLAFHTGSWAEVAGVRTFIGATGYTGEYGYELFYPREDAVSVWRALLEVGRREGLVPCGLAARDSLRFEAALPLYGHEIGPNIDPFSAGLGIFVQFGKGEFLGRDFLMKIKLEGPANRLIGFEMVEPSVPREGYTILVDGKPLGHVTSGMKSPTTGRFLGMGYVPARFARVGTEIEVVIREKPRKAVVVKRPFYTPAYRRGPQGA